jgi:GTPase
LYNFVCYDILGEKEGDFMLTETKKIIENAYLVGVTFSNKENVELSLLELKSLCETAGLVVVGKNYQMIRQVTPATLIGSGKIEEIKSELEQNNASVVVFDYELSGSQVRNLSDIFGVKVIDRITLILDIFAQRAMSREGKLQVELAQLKYNLPRLAGISGTSGRFGGSGVGMRGPGETKLELDKRIAQNNILRLEKEIERVKQNRQVQRKARQISQIFKVAIVGYTNAGKSTLLNLITKSSIYADDKLFATLDTTSRTVWLDYEHRFVLTDTVGFISKLPHSLIDAFSSTLEEASDADLILHVIDVSNPYFLEQVSVVEKVLSDLKINCPVLKVYNKCDKIENKNLTDGVYISAKNNVGIDELKNKILKFM